MAVTRADKTAELKALAGLFAGADAAILLDYRGIDVPQVTELRREIRKARGGYRVVKNTLAKRALAGTSFESLSAHFAGTTAVAYTSTDPVALAKALTTFMKNVPALQIKAAVVQGQPLTATDVSSLASLPGKPELYALLLALLQAPLIRLVRVLHGVPRDLMSVLVQAEQKRKS